MAIRTGDITTGLAGKTGEHDFATAGQAVATLTAPATAETAAVGGGGPRES